MKGKPIVACSMLVLTVGVIGSHAAQELKNELQWTSTFVVAESDLSPTGRNPYFILEPGYQLVLEGKDKGNNVRLVITVLDEIKRIGQVQTRVVEERETNENHLVEVSRNFFAICRRTNNVYYFGEEVDIYREGKVVSHEGAWLSGAEGAKFGLAMPGTPLLGRYYQEIAPGTAMDRAEIMSISESLTTPAADFASCLMVEETTPLEPGNKESKYYAAGVGLLKDGPLKLVRHGAARE